MKGEKCLSGVAGPLMPQAPNPIPASSHLSKSNYDRKTSLAIPVLSNGCRRCVRKSLVAKPQLFNHVIPTAVVTLPADKHTCTDFCMEFN